MEPDKLLETVKQQIDRLDQNYQAQLASIDKKIDKIVDITNAVATLQERSVKHNDEIMDLRTIVRANQEKADESAKRIHMRIDSVSKTLTEYDDKIEDKINSVNSELKKYIHIGLGMWIAASLFISVIQWLGYDYMKTLKESYTQLQVTVTDLNNTVRDLKIDYQYFRDSNK